MTAPFDDMHCHLDFMADDKAIADAACTAGSSLFANTVTPAGYERARAQFAACECDEPPTIRIGCGFHPWYAAEADLPLMLEYARNARFLGEIGLDFGVRASDRKEFQVRAFSRIAHTAAASGNDAVLSIHAIKSADIALDVLERTGALEACTCVFHWFSGTSDQLKRAIDAGCWFSVGPLMAASRRGREFVKAIPLERLLLETDAPPTPPGTVPSQPLPGTAPQPSVPYTFADIQDGLSSAFAVVKELKTAQIAAHPDRYPRRLRDADPAEVIHQSACLLLQ